MIKKELQAASYKELLTLFISKYETDERMSPLHCKKRVNESAIMKGAAVLGRKEEGI